MERKDKIDAVKAFVKTYWKEMLFPALGAGIFVGVLTNRRKNNNHFDLQPLAEKIDTDIFADIDNDIFTDLAPKIEQAVLNSGIEKVVFDTSYDLDDLTHKVVTVTVETINGD